MGGKSLRNRRRAANAKSPSLETIEAYNSEQSSEEQRICKVLRREIDRVLSDSESKIWHAHPVWFLDGNPIVGYGKQKGCIRLMFWSGQSFDVKGLTATGSFKAAEVRYTTAAQIDKTALERWLEASKRIQWDYKNIVKRRGKLVRLP